jgi:hypothetical protein
MILVYQQNRNRCKYVLYEYLVNAEVGCVSIGKEGLKKEVVLEQLIAN